MAFDLVPALAFTASVSTISSDTANKWRTYIARSLDTLNGGEYTNTTPIRFSAGSAGWRFDGLVRVGGTGTLQLDAGATVTVNANVDVNGELRCKSGSTLRLYGGAGGQFDALSNVTCNGNWSFGQDSLTFVNGASGHRATWAWGQFSDAGHGNGSTDTYSTGAVLAINTALATLGPDGVLTINGSSGHGATVSVGQYGSFLLSSAGGTFTGQSGSLFTLASGAFVSVTIGGGGHAGSCTFGADATVTFDASSSTTHAGTSTETYASGAIVTDGSTKTRSGPTTRTGSVILSGAGAWTGIRRTVGNSADQTFDGRAQELILTVGGVSGDITYTLDTIGAGESCTTSIKLRSNAGHQLDVKTAGGTLLYSFTIAAGQEQTVQFYCTGSNAWERGIVGQVI